MEVTLQRKQVKGLLKAHSPLNAGLSFEFKKILSAERKDILL